MKKNGFVFIESIVVLVVVALSLAMLTSSYSLVKRKTQEKEYYNKASDKYLLYSISNLGTDDACNYAKECPSLGGDTFKEGSNITFRADIDNCPTSKLGKIVYDCNAVFNEMHIVHIYVVENVLEDLYDDKSISFYDNGTLEFMKSLKKCNDVDFKKNTRKCNDPIKYMIGVFERGNGEYHYAAIEI